jgi:hypothetical protein
MDGAAAAGAGKRQGNKPAREANSPPSRLRREKCKDIVVSFLTQSTAERVLTLLLSLFRL